MLMYVNKYRALKYINNQNYLKMIYNRCLLDAIDLFLCCLGWDQFLRMKWSFIDDYDDRHFMGYDMAKLNRDTFYLSLKYKVSDFKNLFLYTLNRECVECPYLSALTEDVDDNNVSEAGSKVQVFPTNVKLRIASEYKEYLSQDQTSNVVCDVENNFGQFGIYHMDVNSTGCHLATLKEPVNIYSPIVTVILIYLALFIFIYGIFFVGKKCFTRSVVQEEVVKKERIRSLDTFRGITIVVMIFVNFGAGGYEIFEHAVWNGLHLADLVFPCFVWIMGVCIPISLTSSFKKEVPNKVILINVLKRSLKLFCLGIFLGSGSDLKYLRLFGVLQRFGVAYLVVTTICLCCMKRPVQQNKDAQPSNFDDILSIIRGWGIVLIVLIFHTFISFCVAAPGCPWGYLGPGGLHKNQSYTKCVGGATGYIDGLLLGNHMYQNPTIYDVYESKPFDPEGVVGCLTTIFHTFLGVQAGVTLITYKNHSQRLLRWMSWAVITGLIGGGLSGFSKENGPIPINKNLWSLSFVMVTTCFAFTLLFLCYILIDVKKWWSGKPFLFSGMNAILMYIGHELTDGHFPVRWYIHNEFGDERRTHFLALLSDSWGAGIWVLVSYYLYRINYFFII